MLRGVPHISAGCCYLQLSIPQGNQKKISCSFRKPEQYETKTKTKHYWSQWLEWRIQEKVVREKPERNAINITWKKTTNLFCELQESMVTQGEIKSLQNDKKSTSLGQQNLKNKRNENSKLGRDTNIFLSLAVVGVKSLSFSFLRYSCLIQSFFEHHLHFKKIAFFVFYIKFIPTQVRIVLSLQCGNKMGSQWVFRQ